MHTPTLVSTAFTAAVLFAGQAQAAPVRRGSVVDDDIAPRSGPPSRRGSTTEELSSSRRGSIVDDIVASRRRSINPDSPNLSRRGSGAPPPKDRRRSSVVGGSEGGVPSPARRSSLASPQDILNARRRSNVDPQAANDEARRNSLYNDIVASRKRSLAPPEQEHMLGRRSSLASAADIIAARRRSATPLEDAPVERRSVSDASRVHPFALPNRKAFVAPPDEHLEHAEEQDTVASRPPLRRSVPNGDSIHPFALPNRKAFVAPPTDLQEGDEVGPFTKRALAAARSNVTGDSRIDPARLPNRKAFIAPPQDTEEAVQSSSYKPDPAYAKRAEPAVPQVHPSSLPNRKAFIEPPTQSGKAERDSVGPKVLPIYLPNRKAFIAPPEDSTNVARDIVGPKVLPIHLPNRKAFIQPIEPSAEGDSKSAGFANLSAYTFPVSPPVEEKKLSPLDIPNRKAWFPPADNNSAFDSKVIASPVDMEITSEVTEELETSEEQEDNGTAIALTKRAGAPFQSDGVVDLAKATAHLDHISVKYQKGIIAYQKSTGKPLFDSELYTEEELAEKEAEIAERESILAGTSDSHSALTRRAAVALKSYNSDLLWAGKVKIGTPAQDFTLDFDTGSADTWVPGTSCESSACAGHNKYDPSLSSTSQLQSGSKLDIKYGDGSETTGTVYTDTVSVGGVTAGMQAIGVADTLSDSFADDPQDGIMGMGYQSISQLKEKPYFQTLVHEGAVPSSRFSFSLNPGHEGGSELYLGGANPKKYSGDFEWHDVVSESYWVLEGDAYVDNQPASEDFYAIVDTGTTVVIAPPKEAEEFWSNVPGSQPWQNGYYTFPCNNAPDVSFSFGGKKWEMEPETINLGSTHAGSEQCVGSVVGMDVGVSAWIMGDSFLKNVYTTFDLENNAVGFADKKQEDQEE